MITSRKKVDRNGFEQVDSLVYLVVHTFSLGIVNVVLVRDK